MKHAVEAKKFNRNEERVDWHNQTLWMVRNKRDKSSQPIPEWEALREAASTIKSHTMAHLDEYLIEFEKKAQENGVHIHWASNDEEHNRIVHEIIQKQKGRKVVKSKSMLTEECHLNEYLQEKGIEVIDTDLGERIIQLADEKPSHIVMPAIHKKKEEISHLFHEKLGTEAGNYDPIYLTRAARAHLREKFLSADVAITGVNFAIAETGGFVICTNEGNADMGVHLAPVHIACMGIEKLIPKLAHLGVFLRLLARSGTGQPITVYSSHFHQPAKNKELHLVLVDNGRTEQLGRPDFRKSLHCIRCGACMNTCPVYRRSGGHSYGYTVPGPIGSILAPGKNLREHSTLPFASSLCGSCSDVCPVKIDIHDQLYKWRQLVAESGNLSWSKKQSMQIAAWVLARPAWYRFLGSIARKSLRILPRWMVYNSLNVWGKSRELPEAPKQSFQEWYKENRKHETSPRKNIERHPEEQAKG